MVKDNRNRFKKSRSQLDKMVLYTGIAIILLAILIFSMFAYSKKLNKNMQNSALELEKIVGSQENTTENTQSASTKIGKTVDESKNETSNNTQTKQNETTKSNEAKKDSEKTNNVNITSNAENEKNTVTNTNITENKTENKTKKSTSTKELKFIKPVDGEIFKEYAKENLIYSATLDEWTTHSGIDIKADKTTVVKAAEAGTVKSIKNDPRYGLTIVIEHDNNFQTVYSNLLTSEFVVEGEKVEKGQSIGTVGNTAVFEISDEPHLHFEILKNSIPEDPKIYI
mgnify:CR=1 FL=1